MKGRILLGTLLVLAAGVRLAELGEQPLWLDEASTAEFAERDWRGTLFAEAQHPPLYYLLMHFVVRLLGSSEAALRLPSVVFGVLGVWAAWLLARRIAADAKVAWAAAALCAVSPYLLYLSQEARSYSLVLLLGLLSTILFWDWAFAAARAAPLRLLLYALLCVALLHTHYFAAFLLLAHEVTYWLHSRRDWQTWLAARACAATLFLPWLAWAAQHIRLGGAEWIESPLYYAPLTILRYLVGYGIAAPNIVRLTEPLGTIVREEAAAVLLTVLPLLWLAARGLRMTLRREPGPPAEGLVLEPAARTLLAAAVLLPLLVLIGLSAWRSLLHDRNLAFQAPFVMMLVALGWASLPRRTRPPAAFAAALSMAFAVWSYLGAPGTALGYQLRYGKEDWRGAAQFAQQHHADAVLLAPEYIRLAFLRYWAHGGGGPRILPVEQPASALRQLENAQRFVLVLSHDGKPEQELRESIEREWTKTGERFFPQQAGIRVIAYGRAEGGASREKR